MKIQDLKGWLEEREEVIYGSDAGSNEERESENSGIEQTDGEKCDVKRN